MNRWDRSALIGAGLWQFVTWGGRIGLLTDAESFDPWNWFRIGGSLVLGLAVLIVGLGLVRSPTFGRAAAWAYLLVAIATWGRSLYVNLTEPNSVSFRLMHLALALVTWTLGVLAVRATTPSRRSAPAA